MSTAIPKEVNLKFLGELSQQQFDLIEVEEELLDLLLKQNDKILIKSYEMDGQKAAMAVTSSHSFRPKLSENSNQMFVSNLSQGLVVKQTHTFVELERVRPPLWQLAEAVRKHPVQLEGSQGEKISAGVGELQLLEQCQVSPMELQRFLIDENNRIKFHLFQWFSDMYLFFEPGQLYELLDQMLIFINAQPSLDLNALTPQYVLEQNDGIIKQKYCSLEVLRFGLQHLCSSSAPDCFRLSPDKILKSVALALLQVKESYYLKEFVQALKHALELATPLELSYQPETNGQQEVNLFEGYEEYDLSCLKGLAVIIPQKEVVTSNDDLIMMLDPYFSKQLEGCFGSAEKRLETLFQLKQRWTYSELQYQLEDFIDLNITVESYLMKNCKILREKNPFRADKDITYYIKKF